MRLYAFDVGAYVRAPLVPNLSGIVDGNPCVVTLATLQVFRHRLSKSLRYFLERHGDIKHSIISSYHRHIRRRLNARQALRFLEEVRRHKEDEMLYTVLRAMLESPGLRETVGEYLDTLLTQLDNTHNVIGILDVLYFLLKEDTFVPSVEHVLNHYLMITFPQCKIGVGADFKESIQIATRQNKGNNDDKEDMATLLSICRLNAGNADGITVVTTDHELEKALKKLQKDAGYCKTVSILLVS